MGYVNVAAVKTAGDMLLRGFTSVRDMGGPVFGLKKGIDAGLVAGPRIWPSRRDDLANRRAWRLPAADRHAGAGRATSPIPSGSAQRPSPTVPMLSGCGSASSSCWGPRRSS